MASLWVTAIFGAAFTVTVATSLGFVLLKRLRLQFCRTEAALLAFLAGSACLSLAVFFLCLVRLAKPEGFALLGGAAIGFALWDTRNQPARVELPPLSVPWRLLFGVIFLAFLLCYFVNGLAPEVSPDGSGYHLGNVARYARNSGFAWDFHSIYASLSQGMEMLFLFAFTFGKHSAAALVEVAFQAALPLLMVCYGRRFGLPRVGAFAAILVYACPVVGITGSSAYIDVSVATLLFAVFYLLQATDSINNLNLLILIGLLAGFCHSVKYTAGIVLPFAAGFVLWRRGARRIPLLLVGASILIIPWILRDWIWLGNPFAPFMNHWFRNPYWTDSMERNYLSGLFRYPMVKSHLQLFLQLTVKGGLVPGFVGPVFLLLPLSLLALRHSQGRRLLLAGVIFAMPAWLNTEVRFLIPAIPFFALALGVALGNSWGVLPALALFHAVLSWPAVMNLYCDSNAWRIRGFPVRAALRLEPESAYIAAHIGDYDLKAHIEQAVPLGERIFSFAGRPAAYLDRDIVVGYESSFGERIGQLLNQRDTREVKAMGIRYLLINDSDGVAASMESDPNSWYITRLAGANGTNFYRIE